MWRIIFIGNTINIAIYIIRLCNEHQILKQTLWSIYLYKASLYMCIECTYKSSFCLINYLQLISIIFEMVKIRYLSVENILL